VGLPVGVMQGPLFQWLRKKPHPVRLRIRNVDDETNTIEINASSSQRWKLALEAIKASRAVTVEALDKEGNILRARELESDPEGASEEERDQRSRDRSMSNERKEVAAMLDRYGERLNQAFREGANAAAKSHEALVGLVETLTENLNLAIVNMHTLSVNYAKQIQESAGVEGDSQNDRNSVLLSQMVAAAISNGARKGGDGG
jgi:hypothetical protein